MWSQIRLQELATTLGEMARGDIRSLKPALERSMRWSFRHPEERGWPPKRMSAFGEKLKGIAFMMLDRVTAAKPQRGQVPLTGGALCTGTQYRGRDGRCRACPAYQRARRGGTACGAPRCKAFVERLGRDGKCRRCPPFTRTQGAGRQCGPDRCTSQQTLRRDGSCKWRRGAGPKTPRRPSTGGRRAGGKGTERWQGLAKEAMKPGAEKKIGKFLFGGAAKLVGASLAAVSLIAYNM